MIKGHLPTVFVSANSSIKKRDKFENQNFYLIQQKTGSMTKSNALETRHTVGTRPVFYF